MKLLKRAILYGFLLWLIPFLASVIIFPLKKTDPAFFQSSLGLISMVLVVILSVFYFKKVQGNIREGIVLGLVFITISWIFDYLFFIWGPIKMPVISYVKEIGIGYLAYFVIAAAFGYLLGYKKPASE